MSCFYLSPVKGDMPIHLIETIVENRIQFLSALFKGESTGFNEYIIEGSVYDNVGHFMLCVMSIIYQNRSFMKFVVLSETELFIDRVKTFSSYDLRCFAKKIVRTIRKYDTVYNYIDSLYIVCQRLLLKSLAQHVCFPEHNIDCENYSIQVPFRTCLPYVTHREVQLNKGIATIHCGKWKSYLTILFKQHLNKKLSKQGLDIHQDPRIREILLKVVANKFPLSVKEKANILLSTSVDHFAEHFPPCMRNLHTILRDKHRLSHQQRFYYSLFLKDIGMPVEEAVEFWKGEYRKTPVGASCCHSWEKDEKKFIYGIRHMYGLEGGRKNYTSISCSRLQETMNSSSEGGCSFKVHNLSQMKNYLDLTKINEDCLSHINNFIYNKKYVLACKAYHKELYPENREPKPNEIYSSFTPVIYYTSALNNK